MLKYTHIRPRRMAYGGRSVTGGSGVYSTVQLLNNSSYAEYLILHHWWVSCNTNGGIGLGVFQQNLVSTPVTVIPYLPTEAPPPGALTYGTTSTQIATGYIIQNSGSIQNIWPLAMPFCMIPPGWAFIAQCSNQNNTLIANVLWQAIKPEQLDEGQWLAANANLLLNYPGS